MNLAYVAGIVDGEGCIGFSRCRSSYFPRILVTNTDRDLLLALQAQFGGDIKSLTLRQANWKQGYYWRIQWGRTVDFLDRIYPWLRVKRRQAETVFAWDVVRQDVECRDLLEARMRWLNKKGPVQGSDPVEAIALSEARRTKGKK